MTFYKKQGRRYIPVSEYDSDLMDAMPGGYHLVTSKPGSKSIKFQIVPQYANLLAAAETMRDVMVSAMVEADKMRPTKTKLTPKQAKAWKDFEAAMGSIMCIKRESLHTIVEAGIEALLKKAGEQNGFGNVSDKDRRNQLLS